MLNRSFSLVVLILFVAGALGAKPSVRLTVLGDNAVARGHVKAVWGFACLVEACGHTVLFDTGADPVVLKDNFAALKVDPARIEAVVFSHTHGDHTQGVSGLGVLKGVSFYTPHRFDARSDGGIALGAAGFAAVPVLESKRLFEGIVIGEPLDFDDEDPDGKCWEQCLTIDTPDGLVVVVGCSHPGILSMLEKVKQQTGRPLYLVIGGFHLFMTPVAEVRRIATAMRAMGVRYVSATHCTGDAAACVFREVFGDRYVGAGVGAVIDAPVGK